MWKPLLLKCQTMNPRQMINTAREQNVKVWHHHYGHLNVRSLKKLANEQLVNGLNCDDVSGEMELSNHQLTTSRCLVVELMNTSQKKNDRS